MELVCDSQQQMVDQRLWVVTTIMNTNNVVILVLYQEVTNQVFPLLMFSTCSHKVPNQSQLYSQISFPSCS
jgi:hypothetical protein